MAELIFLFPVLIMGTIRNIFRLILGKKIDESDGEFKSIHYLVSLLVWIFVGGWLIYQNQFIYITYVYACPSGVGNKCYKVPADYISEDCEDAECDTRGSRGGRCTAPYIEKIYFENGGYVSFDYCDVESKDKWTCYAENNYIRTWGLQLSERVRVKK